MKRFALLLPMFLSFALVAQAAVSADHVHINDSSEVDCLICTTAHDLAAESAPQLLAEGASMAIGQAPLVLAQHARAIRQRSRAPPAQVKS